MFALPAWIPGSYMIREFARNIVRIRAESQRQPVALTSSTSTRWRAAPVRRPLTVIYEVYAWDLSVRAAHLDQTHGFFNGTSVFLRVLGQEDAAACRSTSSRPADPAAKTWRVATALPELARQALRLRHLLAADYDELIDHPVEMGDFALATFKAHGVAARHRHHRPRAQPRHGAPAGRPEGDLRSPDRVFRAAQPSARRWSATCS